MKIIFFGILTAAFRRPENIVSKIICLVFAKWSFRLMKPLESSSLQFHAVAFIARFIEGPEQFYLACTVRVSLYAVCNKFPRFAKFELCKLSQRQHSRKIVPLLSIIHLSIFVDDVIERVLWLLMSTTNSIYHRPYIIDYIIAEVT